MRVPEPAAVAVVATAVVLLAACGSAGKGSSPVATTTTHAIKGRTHPGGNTTKGE